MTQEEKAKAYDEAIEKAKVMHEEGMMTERLEYLFPELAESEDEKVRKVLIKETKGSEVRLFETVTNDEFVAWLEKQSEIDKSSYEIAEKEKREFIGDGFIKCYADFQDFKEGETYWLEYVGNDNYNVRSDNLLGKTYHITPCQLYTIFKKMTWLEKQGEQKQEWSLQDEKNLDDIFCAIRLDNSLSDEKQDRLICWLQQYRPYIHKDKKPVEWSEEDSIICQEVVHVIDNYERFEQERNHKNCVDFRHYQILREWLKSLKERLKGE